MNTPTLIQAKTARNIISLKANDQGQAPTEIELLRTGMWDTPYHGMFMVTLDDLREYLANIEANVRPSSSTAGLPIDYEHRAYEGAAGWMKAFEVRPNDDGGHSLWCTNVEWTPTAAKAIVDGEYKFFSPEFCPDYYEDPEEFGKYYSNVLLGGGITNRPLFKDLKPLTASDGTSDSTSGLTRPQGLGIVYIKAGEKSMLVLDEVRKLKASETNADQKAFLSDHKAELSEDERKEHGLADAPTNNQPAPAPAPTVPVTASDATKGLSASDLKAIEDAGGITALVASAKAGQEAKSELQVTKANDIINRHVERGAVKRASEDRVRKLLLASDGNGTRADLEALLDELPENTQVKGDNEIGNGGNTGGAVEELDAKVKEHVKANDGVAYVEAQKFVLANNEDLKQRVNAERAAR